MGGGGLRCVSVDGGGGIAVRECICVRMCGWRGGGGRGGLRCVSNFVCVDGGGDCGA